MGRGERGTDTQLAGLLFTPREERTLPVSQAIVYEQASKLTNRDIIRDISDGESLKLRELEKIWDDGYNALGLLADLEERNPGWTFMNESVSLSDEGWTDLALQLL